MANSGVRLKPSPSSKQTGDPTHTSYEFSLPYTTRRSGSQLREISPGAEVSSSVASLASHEMDPVYEDDEEALARRAQGLAGKYIDEFGNILDWDGTVLGVVHGDLPSMVGRPVSESGHVLDPAGDMVGYVSENYIDVKSRANPRPQPPLPPRELDRSLKVDEEGNILDRNGEIVGKLTDRTRQGEAGESGKATEGSREAGEGEAGEGPSTSLSPSEVYLDVKSTHDGIQLIIKIPTVFNPRGDVEN